MKDPVNRDFDEIGQEALRVLLVVADVEMLLSLTALPADDELVVVVVG